jgi:hypothetical protein
VAPGDPGRDDGQTRWQESGRSTHGEIVTAISDGLLKLLKAYYGEGPTQARTYYEDDLVVCLLRGGFSPSSRHCSRRSSEELAARCNCRLDSDSGSRRRSIVTDGQIRILRLVAQQRQRELDDHDQADHGGETHPPADGGISSGSPF